VGAILAGMKKLAFAALLFSLAACNGYDRGVVSQPTQAVPVTCKRQEVYCYLTNFSFGDTLLVAPAKLVIDDSLIVAEEVPRNSSGSERFSTLIRLCEGIHRVHVQFGPYIRDTTFTVPRDTAISLLTTMLCRNIPELANEDGLGIATLIRDGKGGPD
jgi:hypothetical protein